MTTLYRPVPLTSAAQADALPRGLTAARIEEGRIAYTEDLDLLDDEDIGADDLYVLVPIEAEEVIGTELRHQLTDSRYDIHVMRSTDMDNARWQVENNPKTATGRIMRQYRTPWEEAQ